ncbi:hypothetical protein N657DRAFT_643659 [Parathielavia appendiculata]|uniref:RWD domain-containing protein n=1 Tax=Parathielavia appendiculata TaxID=2587402 RepID=A0AAN6Z527_9PEZI|nr:hypothetical protein N657DRAFT_643659 [Parathielavia appendiculata]
MAWWAPQPSPPRAEMPEGLAIIDLDSPWSPPRRLSSHGLPWLVVDVQWSPFAARDYWVASTANHRCLVWNLNKRDDSSSGAIEHSLQAHSRAITDINFSAHHPDSLATCAVDGYVYCWDLRRPRQPVLAFCDWFAGATQVKYNRQDPFVLASAHDRWLHIWDIRRAAEPLKTISAHTSKIYGIDWNRTKSTCIVTCSLDKSIKFWDYAENDEAPRRVIRTDFPVWRARHTPFGHGLLAMPQTEPGNLFLYDQRPDPETPMDGTVKPVAVFPGHGSHKAKEFLWRSRGGVSNEGIDNREFQLVSWGEDNELRLHKVEHELLESVGHVRGAPLMKNLILTRKGATYKTFRTVDDAVHRDRRNPTMSDCPGNVGQLRQSALSIGLDTGLRRVGPSWRATSMKAKTNTNKHVDKTQLQIGWMKGITMSKRKSKSDASGRPGPDDSGLFGPGYDNGWGEPDAIQDEFLRISSQLPNVKWDNIDWDSLTLNASLKGPWGVNRETIFIKVKVDIPTSYPKTKAPKFYVEKSSFMPDETHRKLEHELHELAHRFLLRKQNCLYTAFIYLLGEADLETSTSFFHNVRDFDDDTDGLADESSSEEDENDNPTGGSVSMSQELSSSTELGPSATLVSTQRQAVTPLPMFCGARFSNDGRALFALPHPDSSKERPKGEPTFAGFGRLSHGSPPPKQRFHDETSATDEQSGESDDSESTTSTDSEPTTVHKINPCANESIRSSGGGTGAGTGTGTGTGTSRKRPGKPKNVKQFAQEYAIFGEGADVCSHNAAVAEKYGYQDLVHIWKYAALLLRRDIPLEIHDLHHSGQPILVIAKDAAAIFGSSLAGHLISDLFDYFERIADIQMLAMLACIFGDYSIEEEAAIAASHLPQPKTPLPMKAPSFSLEYFPTDPALWNLNYKTLTPAKSGSIEPRSHSYSCGETPPNPAREHLREMSQTQSLSTSPSNSLPRALAGIRLSPVAWAGSSMSGTGPDTPGTSRTSFSDDEYWKDDLFSMVPVAVSCIPENQGLFDDDGWMSTPLIDRSHFQLYSSYRYTYAEMLQMWSQPLSRLEIMKFDVLREDKLPASGATASKYPEDSAPNNSPFYPAGATSPTSPFADRRGFFQELLTSGRGVDITGFCRVHPGVPLEPAEYLRPPPPTPTTPAATSSSSINHTPVVNGAHADLVPQTEMECVYCWEPVIGLYTPCLACGCCPVGHDWAGLRAALLLAGGDGGGAAADDRHREKGRGAGGGGGGGGSSGAGRESAPPGSPRPGGGTTTTTLRSAKSRRKSAPADAAKFHLLRRMRDSAGTPTVTSSARPIAAGDGTRMGGGGGGSRSSRRGQDDSDIDRTDRQSVASGVAGALLAGPISAAQLSLGKRLKKQLEDSGRPGTTSNGG